MAEKLDICKKIEIAILSDTELTNEQKDHIDNCESCKALLSQVSSMKSDLGEFSVPGIRKGQIADSVMASIKKQKTSVPFPKFKLTHHLGTAAAVAIILVATLVISKPFNTNSPKSVTSDNTPTEQADNTSEAHMLSANFATITGEESGDVLNRAKPSSGSSDVLDDAAAPMNTVMESYSYIGKELSEYKYSLDYADEELVELLPKNNFEGIDFGSNLEENVKLANERIFALTGKADFFNAKDFDSNEDFLKALEELEL